LTQKKKTAILGQAGVPPPKKGGKRVQGRACSYWKTKFPEPNSETCVHRKREHLSVGLEFRRTKKGTLILGDDQKNDKPKKEGP